MALPLGFRCCALCRGGRLGDGLAIAAQIRRNRHPLVVDIDGPVATMGTAESPRAGTAASFSEHAASIDLADGRTSHCTAAATTEEGGPP